MYRAGVLVTAGASMPLFQNASGVMHYTNYETAKDGTTGVVNEILSLKQLDCINPPRVLRTAHRE